MPHAPLRAATLEETREAEHALRGICIRTPLVRMNWTAPPGSPGEGVDIYLKLENLQPTVNSFKLRGAANALAHAPDDELQRGVVTASAGNMAQGLAAVARRYRAELTTVVPDHAPQAKLDAIARLGGKVIKVPFAEWWRIIESHDCPQASGYFVHPVEEQVVLAGHSTIGLEIASELNGVNAVVVPYGGGALSCGIASAMRELQPGCKVFACEPETAAPLAKSFEEGRPCTVDYVPTFVDGCGGKSVLGGMWPLARSLLSGAISVPISEVVAATKLLVERNKVVAEGAGACPVAAAMMGKPGQGKVCRARPRASHAPDATHCRADAPLTASRPVPRWCAL